MKTKLNYFSLVSVQKQCSLAFSKNSSGSGPIINDSVQFYQTIVTVRFSFLDRTMNNPHYYILMETWMRFINYQHSIKAKFNSAATILLMMVT